MKKSQLRKLIRENIRSIMNEQGNPVCYACVDGIVTPMPQYGAAQNNCGSHPQYGPMFTDPASLNNCTEGGCTLLNFQAAAQNYAGGYGPNWVQMFFNKFNNHPNGCQFLNNRLTAVTNKLNQLQQAGTNPNWQNKLQLKIQAIQAIIAQCCS